MGRGEWDDREGERRSERGEWAERERRQIQGLLRMGKEGSEREMRETEMQMMESDGDEEKKVVVWEMGVV